ncbi:FAD-dependent monooxygenase [Nonomuraea rhodomycinica]|uniref:FAD-dependent monooxygenase n=1 Tax=Nonomuraea rhodomycinica TaxID=1712872 RepID=A0A7Y6MD14_9ACTN|nr:FAD-dependent monooxygenase [Nonomuraea rhodomycinica]NUW42139.1 FAD-dependent monooxygenase [Nonomuraea rhodomycinica]
MKHVLISGAGIAGTTLAYWLACHGFRVTVVERAAGLRSSGSPVDVRGPAVEVAERMGVMERLRAAATTATGMTFVDGSGRRVGGVNTRALQRAGRSREVEVTRTDLAAILYEAGRDSAEYLFGDSMTTLRQDGHGVEVAFGEAAPRRFDLVIGADGLHSATRRLAFGPESRFVRHTGLYVATVPLDGPADDDRHVVIHNTPGRMVAVHPVRGRALAAFIFRSPELTGFDHRDLEQHRRILAGAYAGAGWRVPELLEQAMASDDLWLDAVSQVRIDRWHDGRVALLGDAASSVSLFGDGSTLAMAGAYTLATELASALAAEPAAAPTAGPATGPGYGAAAELASGPAAALEGAHVRAFARYEAAHRELVGPRQDNVARAAALMVPASGGGIAVRNLASRLWPAVAAAGWVRGRLSSTAA